MGVVALRRARGWTVVNETGDAISLTKAEAQTLRQQLNNELDRQVSYTTASPAKARWQ